MLMALCVASAGLFLKFCRVLQTEKWEGLVHNITHMMPETGSALNQLSNIERVILKSLAWTGDEANPVSVFSIASFSNQLV